MLSKSSIESAIVLTKLMNKLGRDNLTYNEGTLLEMLMNESLTLCKGITFHSDDIESGNYTDIVNSIYKAHQAAKPDEDETLEDVDSIHDGWINNYAGNIARVVTDNIILLKEGVAKDVEVIYNVLIDAYNKTINQPISIFTTENITLPQFYMSDEAMALKELIGDVEIPRQEIKSVAYFLEDDAKILTRVQHGISSLHVIDDVTGAREDEIVALVKRFINEGLNERGHHCVTQLKPYELLILVCFFNSIVEDPHFNSNSTSEENRQWGLSHLYLVYEAFVKTCDMVRDEIQSDRIISSLTPNLETLYLRPSLDGELTTLYCYPDNVVNVQSPDLLALIAGAMVEKRTLDSITSDYLNSNQGTLARAWEMFIASVGSMKYNSRYNALIKNVKSALKELTDNPDLSFHQQGLSIDYLVQPSDFPRREEISEETFYKLAVDYTCAINYRYLDIRKAYFDYEKKVTEIEDSLDVISALVIHSVVDFMLKQVSKNDSVGLVEEVFA